MSGQCQNKAGILKEKTGREKSSQDGLVRRSWLKDLGYLKVGGQSSSHFCMMPNKLCAVEACFQQQHGEFKIWQFYMTGVLVTGTNPAFHRGSGNTAAAKHWEGSQLQMEPPHGSACAYIKLSWSFQHGFVDKRLEGNLVSSCSSILNASHDSRNIWNKIFYCRWGLNSPVHQWIEKVWLRVSFALYWTLPFFLFCLQARLPSVKNDPFEDQWKGREICRDSLRLHSWMLWNLKLSSGTAEYVTFIYH